MITLKAAIGHCARCISTLIQRSFVPSRHLHGERSTKTFKSCILTGLQPTGELHLGNYFGAVRRTVELQDSLQEGQRLLVMIADMHSLTSSHDADALRRRVLQMSAYLLAAGVDPDRSILFVQSSVPRHSELCWVLTCLASYARLSALPQFKEKSAHGSNEFCLGLMAYPVLQAADILIYKASQVPVGADQLQHLQFAAQLVKTFHHKYKCQIFPTPRPLMADDTSMRIRSLRDPIKKMSKSDTDSKSRILLSDSDDVIRRKIRKAVTDFTPHVSYDPETRPGVSNLVSLHCLSVGATPEEAVEEADGMTTDGYKQLVADRVISAVSVVREKAERALRDPVALRAVLRAGARRAAAIADETQREVASHTGLYVP